MLALTPCKINIGLNITAKRGDGYHDLETIFVPIPLHDVVELFDAPVNELVMHGIPVPGSPDDNLCIRALVAMQHAFRLPPQKIVLLKNTPMGAGLGAGSANASYVLRLLDQKFNLKLGAEGLTKIALDLGSDCPFFLQNASQFAEGRGEKFKEVGTLLQNKLIVLIKPPIAISTKEAFSGVIPSRPQVSLLEAIKLPMETWKDTIQNDFERSLFPKFPVLAEVKNELYKMGASYASLSGSGATLYGIFEQKPTMKLALPGCWMKQVQL